MSYAVWLDPGRLGGKPCIHGTRLSTWMVADAYWDHGYDECYRMWLIDPGQVIAACWYEGRYGSRRHRKRFGGWIEANEHQLWGPKTFGLPSMPPTKDGR